MNSVYDPALERCNARDIGACRVDATGGYFYRSARRRSRKYVFSARKNRYKVAAKFTRERPLATY